MKKSIVIVTLLTGVAGALQSGQQQPGRTWGQWLGEKSPYQYSREEMREGGTVVRNKILIRVRD